MVRREIRSIRHRRHENGDCEQKVTGLILTGIFAATILADPISELDVAVF
jgi:hypothetical protein